LGIEVKYSGLNQMNSKESISAAFSEEHTEKLTGITKFQLRRWDKIDFFKPSYSQIDSRTYSRAYSFKDIVALRVLYALRKKYGVSFQHLRKVSEKLVHLAEDRWTGTRLYVLNKKVIWQEPGTEKPQEIVSNQYVVPMQLEAVISETKNIIESLNFRNGSKVGIIEKKRFINHNSPVIAGTRISVDAIKRFAKAGYTTDQIIKEYPDLTQKDIEAALEYKNSRTAA
jgi:uncharacterized protein (DUF433 family)